MARPSPNHLLQTLRPVFLLFAIVFAANSALGAIGNGCAYYASPSGTGDGTSPSTPFRLSSFWAVAQPGLSLCLLDGTYAGSDSMITPPAALSGLRGAPIVIKALNDGKVFVTGQSIRRPVFLNFNDWFLVEGINACCSSASVVEISNSSNDVVRRVAGWDAHDGNDKIFGVHSATRSLLEDVAGWGTSRKVYESSFAGDFTTIRRAWGRWERSTVVGPKMVYSLAYNNYDMLIENSLGTWSGERMPATYVLLDYAGQPYVGPTAGTYTNSTVEQPYGIFSADGLSPGVNIARSRLLGSLAYTTATDAFKPQSLLFFTKIDGIEIRDTVGYFEPATSGGRYTFELHLLADGSAPQSDVASNISSFGRSGVLISDGWERNNILQGIAPLVSYGAGETVFDTSRGANLCYAYEDGVLTKHPLWPWPMNDRVRDALVQSGRSPVDITSTVERMFGPIPAPCLASSASPISAALLPVAGRVAGWTTDLQIENPGDRATEAQLTFTREGGAPPVSRTLFLRARQSVTFSDAIQTLFGLSEGIGTFQLSPGIEASRSLELKARIYTATPGGTLGAGIIQAPTATPTDGVSQFVTGLANTAAFRSTVGAANSTGALETFQIIIRDANGSIQGTTGLIALQPATQTQWSLPALFPNASGQPLTVEFRPSAASVAPVGYAILVDNQSSDPTYYASSEPAEGLYLPAVARIVGAGGSNWLTDVTLTNAGDSAASFTVTFLEHDRDNTTTAPYKSFSLPARGTAQFVDALGQWFNLTGTYGGLRVSTASPQGIVVSARTYTSSPTSSGTVGQQVAPVRPQDLITSGSLPGLREDDAFRSNLGFLNPSPSAATLQLTLEDQDGASVDSVILPLPPSGFVQRSLGGLFPTAQFSADQIFTVVFDAGSSPIAAFESIVDNASQDPTFSLALP